MFKILDILAKEKIRKVKKIISRHKILSIFMCINIVFCLCTVSLDDIWGLKQYIPYVPWIVTVYLGLKLINPTQEAIISYQLIELKLVSRCEFKILLAVKLYGVGFITVILNSLFKERILIIFALLNCAVNIYVFVRSSKKSYKLELAMIILVSTSIYFNSIWLSGIIFIFWTIIFICKRKNRYEVLLPFYHVIYKLNLRYSGDVFTDTESDEIHTEVERLFGKEKRESQSWCQNYYEESYKFYWMKEIARISYDKEGYFLRIMISILTCISIFYLPEWYGILAVIICVFTAYDFCQNMFREDVKLYPYGFLNPYKFRMILQTKIPVYTVACFFIIFPMVLVLKRYSWSIIGIAVLIPLFGTIKSFYMPWFRSFISV